MHLLKRNIVFILFLLIELNLYAQGTFQWAFGTGVGEWDIGNDICVDSSGNSYIIGSFTDTTIFDNDTLISAGPQDVEIFIAKFDVNGNILWTKQLGNNKILSPSWDYDSGHGIALDPFGNLYITGTFSDTVNFGNDTLIANSMSDIFIAKYDTSGNPIWAIKEGGNSYEKITEIVIGTAGDIYITGNFLDTTTFGFDTLISTGGEDVFIVKYDSGGNLIWSVHTGMNTSQAFSNGITVDLQGNCYITGGMVGQTIFGVDTLNSDSSSHDIFVVKYDVNGNEVWAKSAGTLLYLDYGTDIDVDELGNIYVIGRFSFDAIFDTDTLNGTGQWNFFIAKYDSNGNLIWVKQAEGNAAGYGIKTDQTGNCYVTGTLGNDSVVFDSILLDGSNDDLFIVKYDQNGNALWAKQVFCAGKWHPVNSNISKSIGIDNNGNCYVTGGFQVTATFDLNTLYANGWNGMQDIFVAKLDFPPAFLVSIISNNISCYGYCDATATANPSGGVPPYVYQWDDSLNQTTQMATGLCAGTYTVVVTDSLGQTDTASVAITEPQPLSIDSIITIDVLCAGDTATAYVSGGTYPYTYVWYPDIGGQCTSCDTTVPTFNVDLSAQADTTWISPDTVRNGFCCGAGGISKCIRFNVTVHPMTEQITFDFYSGGPPGAVFYQINCGSPQVVGESVCIYGATNFCITFCKPGNNMNEYYITAAGNCTSTQTDSIATGLTAGTHVVSVTDANGCTAIDSVTITEPPPLAAFIDSVANIDCFGNCNGFATAAGIGGVSPYNYLWSDGQNTQTAINLCSGTYCVTVTDTNGCLDTVCVTITEPPALTITITSNNVNCFGACDGDATATVAGGTPPYTYQWNDSLLQTTPTADSLCNGAYTVTVTDSNGCVITGNVLIIQPQVLGFIATTTSSTCGLQNGAACVIVFGGVPPYIIVWDDPGLTIGSCIDSVFAGCYNPVVTDANGCQSTMPVCINDIPGPTIDSITNTDLNCFGNANGIAQAFVSLGTPAFTYVWKDSAGLTIDSGLIDVVFGLSGGTYTITVIDANGCTESQAFTINEPTPMTSAIIAKTDVSCFGACDGSATVAVGGGMVPYTFLWVPSNQTTATVNSLCAGLHNVLITDANGCTTTNSDSINQPELLVITPAVTNVSCFGDCDGVISLNVTGGVNPYAYVWLPGGTAGNTPIATNLCAGTYIVAVTDMNGCTTTQSIIVNEPSQLTATITTFPSTCGQPNGVGIVTPSGGTPGYTYEWNTTPIYTDSVATSLLAGCYNVLITDANGCVITVPVCVSNIPGPTIDSISTTDVTCNGICVGTATAYMSGGTSPLTYLWSNGGETTTADSLCAGTHTITVTDLNGCIAIDSVIINEPDVLEVITFGDMTICPGDSAQISFAISGGVNPFINSGNLNNGAIVSPDTTTTYTVIVTDANGCMASGSVTIIVYPPLSSSVTASSDTICAGESTTLTASASGGNGGPYTYTWLNDGSNNSTITVSPTTDSTFTVVVSDGGCSVNDTTSAIVIVEICLGVDEPDVLKGISVYPNPNTGAFVIEMHVPKAQDVQIKIINVLGQEVYTEIAAMTTGIYRKQIDLVSYPKGIYTLQIITDEGVFNKKVIVK